MNNQSSRLPGFYKRPQAERAALIAQWAALSGSDLAALNAGLDPSIAENMIENVIGVYGFPVGIATNFLINDRDYLIPMVIEEPSVVAAVSNAAKLFREGGGFHTSSDEPVMIGQIQVLDLPNLQAAAATILSHKAELMAEADRVGGSIVKHGGGTRDIEVRPIAKSSVGPMLIVHLLMDTRDAMGANAINTAVEHLAPRIEQLTGGRVNLRILSNLTDRRKARAEGRIPAAELTTDTIAGADAVDAIVEAGAFAEVDPYRATTHNKGIMNGVDAVVIATGNDWRAVEAGAHAYAARDGQYRSLTRWWKDDQGDLRGSIELPLALGIVGGATRVHPVAGIALRILGIENARQLSEIAAAVGLAQNLAAIRALATVGIQQGHMRMHARQLALAAGAQGELVARVVQAMIDEGQIRLERAKSLVHEWTTQ
jgi:hydroxymethylglutaryl-CoA reductase